MPKGYWIARVNVLDPERYAVYRDLAPVAFEKYGAKVLARGGKAETMEGEVFERLVVLEFPSFEAARDCYNSPEYQKAKEERGDSGVNHIALVEGV